MSDTTNAHTDCAGCLLNSFVVSPACRYDKMITPNAERTCENCAISPCDFYRDYMYKGVPCKDYTPKQPAPVAEQDAPRKIGKLPEGWGICPYCQKAAVPVDFNHNCKERFFEEERQNQKPTPQSIMAALEDEEFTNQVIDKIYCASNGWHIEQMSAETRLAMSIVSLVMAVAALVISVCTMLEYVR